MELQIKFFTFIFFASVTSVEHGWNQYCFKFTWLGPTYTSQSASVNCSAKIYKEIPCVEPFAISQRVPNTSELWYDNPYWGDITCPLQLGYACIKYTYIYNNAVVNMTHFCGKMMEDTTTVLTDGCYSQKVGGHTIEACACRSLRGGIPCNSSFKISSNLITVIFVFLSVLLIGLI